VLLATVAAFIPNLWFPFLFDDYVHLLFVSNESWRTLIERVLIHHPTGGDMFFRPLGDLTFQLVYQWSGFDFRRWHLTGLAIHAANTLLVLLLSRRISGGWLGACTGALFFGWQSAHVEAVSWVSALYDLLATLFVLLALLEVTGARQRYFAAAAFAALACLSKESAYCLPLLAGLSATLVAREARRLSWWKTLWVAAACALVFLYRYWYLRGIGGYRTASGSSVYPGELVASAGSRVALGVRVLGCGSPRFRCARESPSAASRFTRCLHRLCRVAGHIFALNRLRSGGRTHFVFALCWGGFVVGCDRRKRAKPQDRCRIVRAAGAVSTHRSRA
jgi:hypothetical protein